MQDFYEVSEQQYEELMALLDIEDEMIEADSSFDEDGDEWERTCTPMGEGFC